MPTSLPATRALTTLDGGGGADTLIGGAGNDVYKVDNVGDIVTELAGGGTDTVISSVSFNMLVNGVNVENLTLTGTTSIDATGNALANTIIGNDGSNYIDGGEGADKMSGGKGDDLYFVDAAGDVIVENAGEGTDTVVSRLSYTLGANLENLELYAGSGNLNGTGNGLDNEIIGNSGNNTLNGMAGADTMYGNGGTDVYIMDNVGDLAWGFPGDDGTIMSSVNISLSTNALSVEKVTLTGTAISAVGDNLANVLIGNASNNTLDGAGGADTLTGGAGNDTYVVDNAGDVLTEATAAGTDTVLSSISFALAANFENLTLTGSAAINGTGNSVVNILTGNSGANTLDGGAGADTMIGGDGNDVYMVDTNTDVVTELANQGTDTVNAAVSYVLGANLENLNLTGSLNANGTGNALANVITGNGFNNTLDGGAGTGTLDTLAGGGGDDTYLVHATGDIVTEAAGGGIDTVISTATYILSANVEKLTLTGTANIDATGNVLDNTLTGNSGNNTLDGGTGNDVMIGGTGNDTYVVDAAGDSVTEAAGAGTDTVLSAVSYTLGANLENLTLTGIGDNNGTGNTLANIVTGNIGDNTLDGGVGADTMVGNGGDDTYFVDSASDVVVAGADTDTIISSVTYTLGANAENLILTGMGNLNATGNAAANILTGNAGNNTLDGGAGFFDTMIGGAGNDTYIVRSSGDVVTEQMNGGTDTVISYANITLAANVENLIFAGTTNTGVGNALNNVITGSASGDLIDGGAGADTMIGGAGNDYYVVDNAGDVITETATGGASDIVHATVSYTLGAYVEDLTLDGAADINATGNTLDNEIRGNSGDNTLNGMAGADTMFGNGGDDTFIVDNIGDVVVSNSSAGVGLVLSSVSYSIDGTGAANITLTGTSSINATGSTADNVIIGNDGNNTLDGNFGTDTFAGGKGNDVYIVYSSSDIITENSGEGTDTVMSNSSFILTENLENLTLTGSSAISGVGNALNNILTGNSNSNTLDGSAGADTMIGGDGNDYYKVDNAGDVVTELSGNGTDTVESSLTYTLGANLENLVLKLGAGSINGTGNALNNIITGNEGDNTLDGGLGDDSLVGGGGNDTYIVDAHDTILEGTGGGTDTVIASGSYTLAANLENLTLSGTASINGTGNSADNVLLGNSGDNTLDGGVGSDSMTGGAGNDLYIVDSVGDVVTELSGGGTDEIQSSVSFDLSQHGANVENLTLLGSLGLNGTGNALDNIITGNIGDNTLDGGAGGDALFGGNGNDTYIVDDIHDLVYEASGFGTDSVISYVSYTLTDNVENLTLAGGTNIDGTGNDSSNIILGNGGANTLDGGLLGNDVLTGGGGNDTYIISHSGITVNEGSGGGTDLVQSSISYTLGNNLENLTLTGTADINGIGNGGANTIVGNDGDNLLDGGFGNDVLTGGKGADTFNFSLSPGQDTITDFKVADHDTLDIHTILSGYNSSTDDISQWLQLTVTGGNTVVSVDVDGAGTGSSFTDLVTLTGVSISATTQGELDALITAHTIAVQ
ncbi:MAG: calcium-binding protein [Micavibrio sp.]|nr:calcium-binding protein [Micavibrio sp.]